MQNAKLENFERICIVQLCIDGSEGEGVEWGGGRLGDEGEGDNTMGEMSGFNI